MPIKIVESNYADIFGNNLSFYQANAGDKTTLTMTIEANIMVTEVAGTSVDINWMDDEFNYLGSSNWLQEGFRIGDTVNMEIWEKATDTLNSTRSYTIDFVSETILRPNASIGAIFDHNLYWLRFSVPNRVHSDLVVNLNHMLNDTANSNLTSLIDGETTSIRFDDITGLAISAERTGDVIGNQSGQYLIDGVITRIANAHSARVYELELNFVQNGVYNSEWFDLGNCLKLATRLKFFSLPNEIQNVTILEQAFEANTGWFGTSYNQSVIDSTLVSAITDPIDYGQPTTTTFTIDTNSTEFYIGAQYVSTNTDYYKNKVDNQNDLGLLLDAYVPLAVGTYTSNGGLYTIDVDDIDLVGTETTVTITFTPLTGFEDLFDGFEDGDRLFYIWCKAGNVNHLVYSTQLEKAFDAILPLTTRTITLIRHDNNTTTQSTQTVDKTNTEDDLAISHVFIQPANVTYTGYRVKIEAHNTSTDESFTLEEMFFDYSSLQINGSGQYLVSFDNAVSNNLQSTSAKKRATLELSGTNTITLYYPFVNRWETWLSQTNADVTFYPNQNKNWVGYVGGDWEVRYYGTLETADIAYYEALTIPIEDYDTELLITSSIELYREGDDPFVDSPVTSVFDNEIMTIKAIHTYNGYTKESSWGEITIEDFEGQPRWNSSTVVDYDNNQSNPLLPITGTVITTTDAMSETVFTCKLDTSKLNNSDFKITSKIFLDVVTVTGLIFQHDEAVATQGVDFLKAQFQL